LRDLITRTIAILAGERVEITILYASVEVPGHLMSGIVPPHVESWFPEVVGGVKGCHNNAFIDGGVGHNHVVAGEA
jgi:hypothetical protein